MRTLHSSPFGRALLLAGAGLTLAACSISIGPAGVVQGSGHARTESRTVQGFDQVSVSGSGTLTITQGGAEGLSITADDNVLPSLRSDVSGGRLQLGPQGPSVVNPQTPIRYELTVKQVSSVSLSGSADMRAASLDANQLGINISGSGTADVGRLTANGLTTRISGSGTVTVAGQAAQQTVDITGNGTYRAANLASRRATVNVAGSGDCALRVSDSLDVHIAGSGSVSYVGSPSITEHVSGSGSITKAG